MKPAMIEKLFVAAAACTTGYYSTGSLTACLPCPAGHECSNAAVAPVDCGPGTYSSSLATSCTNCGPGEGFVTLKLSNNDAIVSVIKCVMLHVHV